MFPVIIEECRHGHNRRNGGLIEDLASNLLCLEHDAIAAYDSTIEKLQDPASKQKIAEFRNDHLRHVSELETMAMMLRIDVPQGGDLKQLLTTGKVAMASLMGDGAILQAMRSHEEDTVTAYERASRHADAVPDSKRVFDRFATDERRHREWMQRASAAS